MKYPLIANYSGDLYFLEDPRMLQREVEPDDVLTHCVEIFDSEGHLLAARVEEKEYPIKLFGGLLTFKGFSRGVVVENRLDSVAEAERLKEIIFSYLSSPRVSAGIPSSQQASEQDSLPALIEKLRLFLRKDKT